MYDFDKKNLEDKIKYFSKVYKEQGEKYRKLNKEDARDILEIQILRYTSELLGHLRKRYRVYL